MVRVVTICILAFALQGCAVGGLGLMLAATGTGLAAGAGVDHTLSGITYKTFAVSRNQLRFATLKTLHRMDLRVVKDKRHKDHHEIEATALDRKIEIELEPLTRRTTRMRVVANQGQIFFKDAATATEIIVQTAQTLDRQSTRRPVRKSKSKKRKKKKRKRKNR
jgi:hypothetical protein